MPITPKRTTKPNIPQATKAKWMNVQNVNAKFYNSAAWRKASRAHKQKHPLCVQCKEKGITTAAEHTDHIIPIEQGGAMLQESNLQSLCKRCHSIKTAKEKGSNRKNTEQ